MQIWKGNYFTPDPKGPNIVSKVYSSQHVGKQIEKCCQYSRNEKFNHIR